MITRHKKFGKHQLGIYVEETKRKNINNPEYLLAMDKIHFTNGDVFLITKVTPEEIKVTTNKIIKKNDIPKFLQGMSHIERADCREIG